jgi:hypothetical protein
MATEPERDQAIEFVVLREAWQAVHEPALDGIRDLPRYRVGLRYCRRGPSGGLRKPDDVGAGTARDARDVGAAMRNALKERSWGR